MRAGGQAVESRRANQVARAVAEIVCPPRQIALCIGTAHLVALLHTPHFAAAAADAGIALQLDALALDRLRASPELAEQAAGLAGNYDLQRIEARLAGLEQSVSATLNVLAQLLQAVRRDAPETDKTE